MNKLIKKIQEPKYLGFIIAFFLAAFSLGYYLVKIDQGNYFVLDNPTDKTIELQLDEESYVLGPYQTVKISLKEGAHFLHSKSDTLELKDSFKVGNEVRGLINPSLSSYIIFDRIYGKNYDKDSAFTAHHFYIDSVLYYGKMKLEKSLYLHDFYLNVDQNYPNLIKSTDTVTTMKKIFRKQNFIDFYRSNYE